VEFLEPDGGVPEFVPRIPTPPPVEPPLPVLTPTENAVVTPDYRKIQDEVRASWLKKFKK
jgi:hypothetical protein